MDKRSAALEGDLPFGALRLPGAIENVRAAADRLNGDPVSRRLMSVARRACLLGRPDPIDIDVFGQCRARLYPRSNRCEKRVFLGVNSWDLEEREAIRQAMHEAQGEQPFVFVDGGANVGLYSLFVASEARRTDTKARIIAVEPDPVNLGRMRFNFRASELGDEILLAPYALGERDDTGLLLAEQSNRGEVRLARAGDTVNGGVEVVVKTLPGVMNDMGIGYIDCLKLDIEGAEYAALSGLFSGIQQSAWPSMIILEVGKGDWKSDASRLCLDKGYVLAKRTSLNVILSRPSNAGQTRFQMESGS